MFLFSAGNENGEGRRSAEITAAEQCEWNIPAWHLDCFGWRKWSWENDADGCSCWPKNRWSYHRWHSHLWIFKVSENLCSDLWVLWAKWYSFPSSYGYGIPCVFSLASTGCRDWLYAKDGTSSWYQHGIKSQSCFSLTHIQKQICYCWSQIWVFMMMITFHQFPPSLLSHRSKYLHSICNWASVLSNNVCDPAKMFLTSDFRYLLQFFPTPPIQLKLGLQIRWETTSSNLPRSIKLSRQSTAGVRGACCVFYKVPQQIVQKMLGQNHFAEPNQHKFDHTSSNSNLLQGGSWVDDLGSSFWHSHSFFFLLLVLQKFVEEVMELVELVPLRNALVGLPGQSGLSTEQRKRLTIAVELVANPSIIFKDEPTSGLDARAAAIVMRTVRNTVNIGRTVVCTIHQPSIEIFEAFDEVQQAPPIPSICAYYGIVLSSHSSSGFFSLGKFLHWDDNKKLWEEKN